MKNIKKIFLIFILISAAVYFRPIKIHFNKPTKICMVKYDVFRNGTDIKKDRNQITLTNPKDINIITSLIEKNYYVKKIDLEDTSPASETEILMIITDLHREYRLSIMSDRKFLIGFWEYNVIGINSEEKLFNDIKKFFLSYLNR